MRGVTEHHALIARAARVDAHGDIAGLLVDGRDNRAGIGVKAIKRVIVADGADYAANHRLEVDVSLGRDFAGDHHQSGSGQGLAGYPAVAVLLKASVKDGVGDLVGDLIGMPFGY